MAVSLPSKNFMTPNHCPISSGQVFHRVHSYKYAGNTFNDHADVEGRFNPVFDNEGNVVPVLYATDSFNRLYVTHSFMIGAILHQQKTYESYT